MKCSNIKLPPRPILPIATLTKDSTNSEVVKSYVASVQLLVDDRRKIDNILNN
jgi:hypothetical protein